MKYRTQADTYNHIIGAMPLTCSWYEHVTLTPDDFTLDDTAYDGWSVEWYDRDEGKTFTVTHDDVMRAIRSMIRRTDRPQYVSDTAAREARNFLFNFDETDFDADTADQVLQVAAFGRVIYG